MGTESEDHYFEPLTPSQWYGEMIYGLYDPGTPDSLELSFDTEPAAASAPSDEATSSHASVDENQNVTAVSLDDFIVS